MQLVCPQCGKTISDAYVDTSSNTVVCDACGTVFYLPTTNKVKRKTSQPNAPHGMKIRETAEGINITYKENVFHGFGVAIFTMIYCTIIWFLFGRTAWGLVLRMNDGTGDYTLQNLFQEMSLIAPLEVVGGLTILVVAILIGIGAIYRALFLLFNFTTIEVKGNHLIRRHRPIAFPFDKAIPTAKIDQLFVKQHIQKGSDTETITYQVHLKFTSGDSKILLKHFSYPKPALYIKHEIEHFLGIENRPVEGEYRP